MTALEKFGICNKIILFYFKNYYKIMSILRIIHNKINLAYILFSNYSNNSNFKIYFDKIYLNDVFALFSFFTYILIFFSEVSVRNFKVYNFATFPRL